MEIKQFDEQATPSAEMHARLAIALDSLRLHVGSSEGSVQLDTVARTQVWLRRFVCRIAFKCMKRPC